jgi:hypothetical protein
MTKPSPRKLTNPLSLAAGAAVAMACAATVLGQARVDTGNALDANNRVGSGGLNSGPNSFTQNRFNNAIVTGNVTAGREFRGSIPYGPSRAFRGNLAGGNVDRFVAGSAGPVQGNYLSNAQEVRPFFGRSEGVAPPPGFTPIGSTGSYTVVPPETRSGADLRIGQVYDQPTTLLPQPGQLLLPGPVDTSTNYSTIISASPLFGVRPLNTGSAADVQFMQRYTTAFGRDGRSRESDRRRVERLQRELSEPSNEATSDGANAPGGLRNWVSNEALPNETRSAISNDALGTDASTGQQNANRVLLAPAVKQSAQYKAMQDRLDQFNASRSDDTRTVADSTREYNEQVKLRNQAEAEARQAQELPTARPPGSTGQPVLPGTTPPGQPTDPAQPGTEAPTGPAGTLLGPTRRPTVNERTTVTSLATGVQAKGLADLLTEAEALMREQKFVSALDKYDLAERAAPNNPLVLLGRANAELGASYYARAETHLREAFLGAPALMMARYDLRQFLGDDRLAFLVKDLKEIANNERNAPRPLILLSYIAYNDGNDRMAAGYLDLAEKRLGRKDPFFDAVRQHWELPAYDPNNPNNNP